MLTLYSFNFPIQFQTMEQIRKKPKVSYVWSYFTVIDAEKGTATCNFCSQKYNYKTTISNLKKHLERRHTLVYLKEERAKDVSRLSTALTPACSSSEASDSSTLSSTNQSNLETSQSSSKKKSLSRKVQKCLDTLLLHLFITDFQSFSILEDEGFVNFVNALNSSYKLPSRKTVTKNILPEEYDKCLFAVRQELPTVGSVCLSTETWSSSAVNAENYLGVTAHYIAESYEMRSILLTTSLLPASYTSADLAEQISYITGKFDLDDKVLLIVTDNTSKIKDAVTEELKKEHFGCFAHTLNRILKDALKIPEELIGKIRSIVSYLRGRPSVLEKFNEAQKTTLDHQEPRKLIQDDPARWNSTFCMIRRFCELQDSIKTTIASINKDVTILAKDEWTTCKELCVILQPFDDIIKEVSCEQYLAGSLIIPLTDGLKSICEEMQKEDFGPTAKRVIDEVLKEINTNLYKIEENKAFALATFLDPRFKLAPFSSASCAHSVKEYCTSLMADIWAQRLSDAENTVVENKAVVDQGGETSSSVTAGQKYSVWGKLENKIASKKFPGSMSAAIIEINRYLEDAFLGRKEDPLVWWQKNEHYYPLMGRVVKTKFNILGTSLPCERLFTKEGALVIKRRSRLQTKNIEKILFLNANSFLIY